MKKGDKVLIEATVDSVFDNAVWVSLPCTTEVGKQWTTSVLPGNVIEFPKCLECGGTGIQEGVSEYENGKKVPVVCDDCNGTGKLPVYPPGKKEEG